jgi:hypothetical protein
MIFRLLIFLLIMTSRLCAETGAQSFNAVATISTNTVSITDVLTFHIDLTFPDTHHPNIDLIKSNLQAYHGLDEPPFYIVKSEVQPVVKTNGSSTQIIDFTIAPQIPGMHFLSAQIVRFDPNTTGNPVEIPTDIFKVDVSIPSISFHMKDVLAPPMPLTQHLPIEISTINQREYLTNPILIATEINAATSDLNNKTIPWISLISAAAVLIAIVLIRSAK